MNADWRRALAAGTAVVAFCLLSGCMDMPEPYAPPMQRKPLAGLDNRGFKNSLAMNDPQAESYILKDVETSLEGGTWRWTRQNPTFKFVLSKTENLRLAADFAVNSETLKATGPVTITWKVNGKVLAKNTYDTDGTKHFEKPVDASWLVAEGDNVVAMELDKVWTSPTDGTQLGVPLVRIGFLD